MFPLAGKDFPTSADQLCTAIQNALAEVFSLAKKGSAITVRGGQWPHLKQVKVDLSGAQIKTLEPPPPPKPKGERQPGVTVGWLDITGDPIRYEKSELGLSLEAREVAFDFAHDAAGNAMLVLKDAADGNVDVKIGKDDLQSLLLAAAGAAAKQQGVTIQELQINLTSQGPRSIGADVKVKAKKLMMSGTVSIRGKADIDDELVASLSDLSCTGEGVIGGMAAAFLQAKLKQLQGRRFPLMTFSLGDVSLRDLNVSTSNGLRVTAQFGSAK